MIDADELMEHAMRDRLDSRELIMQMIENARTIEAEPDIRLCSISMRKDPEFSVYCGACCEAMLYKHSEVPIEYLKEEYKYCHHCGTKVLWR